MGESIETARYKMGWSKSERIYWRLLPNSKLWKLVSLVTTIILELKIDEYRTSNNSAITAMVDLKALLIA